MATERQIAANQRNAALSTGPKTEAGKAASRANATTHGLACETINPLAEPSPAFQARREAWAALYRPTGEVQDWALERTVAASFRIERCERAFETLADTMSERAQLAWDQDRSLDAAKLGAKLAKKPALVARQLEATWHGVDLMIDWWVRLDEALKTGEDWSETQAATALDLLGIPTDLRTGRTPIDDPSGGPNLPYRSKLIAEQVARLEELQGTAMARLDDFECRRAISGASAMLAAPARLVLRYEREAWRQYRESVQQLTAPASEPEIKPAPTPPPQVKAEPIEDDDTLIETARAEIARTMREPGIEGYPAGLDLNLARNAVDGTNPIGRGMPRQAVEHFADELVGV